MKPIVTSIAASSLLAALAIAQPRYTVHDLGTLPGETFSQATYVNNTGLVTGVSAPSPVVGPQHAVLWVGRQIIDMAKVGLGGPNSVALGVTARGQAVGQAESFETDPNNENFCGYGTGKKCLPFLWQGGVMTQLFPLLGGNNGAAGPINIRGEASGVAENSTRDPECPPTPAVNGTGPYVLDFEAAIWGPGPGQIRKLRPLDGDSVGMAFWINDNGQAVGSSGRCFNTILPPFAGGPHAVLWEKDGSVHPLGNLGGTGNPALLGIVNAPFVINNGGQVTGVSVLPGNTNIRAFLWTKEKGMHNLGTLPGDVNSAGLGMNDRGEVVGASVDGSPATGNPRAFLWQNGAMHDLNTLIVGDSPFLQLLVAFGINDVGQIVGFGLTNTFDVHAFLATPNCCATAPASKGVTSPVALPENVHKLLRGRLGTRGW